MKSTGERLLLGTGLCGEKIQDGSRLQGVLAASSVVIMEATYPFVTSVLNGDHVPAQR